MPVPPAITERLAVTRRTSGLIVDFANYSLTQTRFQWAKHQLFNGSLVAIAGVITFAVAAYG